MKTNGFLLFLLLWLLLIGGSYYQQATDDRQYGQKIAYKQAEMFFEHVVLMRKWNSQHGGVYAPVTENNPPNPYLQVPERDIVGHDGQLLTLINPADMTRQLAEMEKSQTGILFHMTSLQPTREENKADPWEYKALQAFQQGLKTYSEFTEINGASYYRFMAPLKLETDCMKCHNAPGQKVGDNHGGISVGIPASSLDDFMTERLQRLQRSHLIIAVMGLIALLVAYWAQSKLARRLTKAENNLQLAYLDALTLLPNRRYYDAFLRREWKRASRHRYPLSMIMIDIDCFKAYNDTLGHQQGDQCLHQVARTLRRYFRRSGDLIARYGGEEFCVVAACDAEQIVQLADIMRAAVEMMHLPHPNSPISSYVTVSLGVATIVPNEKIDSGELMHQADQALYLAKHTGRNRVARYDKLATDAGKDT